VDRKIPIGFFVRRYGRLPLDVNGSRYLGRLFLRYQRLWPPL